MAGMSLSLQGEQLTIFVANDKVLAFKQKSRLLENLYYECELHRFSFLKDLADETNGDIKKCKF